MRRSLFLRLQEAVEIHDNYFTQRNDVVGVRGLSSLQKMTATLRMLAYGTPADAIDDYVRIGESIAIESLKNFVKAIVEIFGENYLRRPTNEDVAKLLTKNKRRGFPGMLGSIDYMHYRSNLFQELAKGRGPEVRYTINEHEYNMRYYLAGGIYPSSPTFVKTIPSPQVNKKRNFASAQEVVRKDVERAFRVLQARFAMIRRPSRFWDVNTMKYIMTAYIILHNMIVEDERELHLSSENYGFDEYVPFASTSRTRTRDFKEFIQMHQQIRDKQAHIQLQNDLVEHLWEIHGMEMGWPDYWLL